MIFIKFSHLPNMQGISYDFIGFHENRWDAAAGGAAGGHPGTEYMDVLGAQESMDSGGYPPEPMNSQGIHWFWWGGGGAPFESALGPF